MKNGDCNNSLKMLTTFNDADAGELTMLDKIFGFDDNTVMAATGLDQVRYSIMLTQFSYCSFVLHHALCLAANNIPPIRFICFLSLTSLMAAVRRLLCPQSGAASPRGLEICVRTLPARPLAVALCQCRPVTRRPWLDRPRLTSNAPALRM